MATNLVGGPANPVYLVDANGNTVSPASGGSSSITSPLGRQADAASVSAALSTEDVALLTALLTTTAFQARIPANGQAAMAASVPVAIASNQSAIPINLQPTTSGGSTPYRNLDLGTTGKVVKNSAGQLYNYFISNNAAAARFVKFYDKATAPTDGDTPIWTFQLPPGAAANVAFPNGIAFANGISIRGTTGVADNDTGAPSTNDIIVNLGYK